MVSIRSPYDGAVVGAVKPATAAEAAEACARAGRAFSETSAQPAWRREQVLEAVAARIAADAEAFARLIVLEAGKPIRDARVEVDRAIQTFRAAAEEAKRIGGEVLPLDWNAAGEGRLALTRRFPVGPVLGITPFNFPLNLVAHKVAPAMASGCPVIIKPAPQTPLSALRLLDVVRDAGWPEGGLQVLPCTNEVAALLVADERLKKLSFTGSAAVGWQLKAAAPKKNATLELGGNAAVVVHEDADLAYATQRIAAGAFGYSGQSCISVQRVYVHESVSGELIQGVVSGAESLRCGDPMDEATQIGPMISQAAAERAERSVRDSGGSVLTGGVRDGNFLRPTVLTDVPPEATVACEEAFAPVVIVEQYRDFEDALSRANDSRYGLQAGVFTRDWERIAMAWQRLRVGAILLNEVPTWRVEHMPYGGVKDSGCGREGVRYAIEDFTEPRLLIVKMPTVV